MGSPILGQFRVKFQNFEREFLSSKGFWGGVGVNLVSHNAESIRDLSYSRFRRSLKTLLFCLDSGATVWTTSIAPSRKVTYLLTYLLNEWMNE